VLAANASIAITGKVLHQPLDILVPVAARDGGLISCAVQTATTAIPFVGCLLAGLDLGLDLNLPLKVKLAPDYTGCTGVLPALTGSLLASLGIDLKVTIPVQAATLYPQDESCEVDWATGVQPVTVNLVLGKNAAGSQCGGNAPTPYPPKCGCGMNPPRDVCNRCKVGAGQSDSV
jgi:hypothetical protein